MATAPAELPRPGVEIIQEFASAAPTTVRPTLVPFVTGPAQEIIEVTNSDGTLNTKARQGLYTQLPKIIAQTSFPSPRGNILEVDVDEVSIRAFFLSGGSLKELPRDPGESFLIAWNLSTEAAVQTVEIGAGFDVDAKTSVFAIDISARLNLTKDVIVTFAGATPAALLTAEEVRDQINDAVGQTVAAVIGNGVTARVQATSNSFGARSSVTIRAGGSANVDLFGIGADLVENRVEGSGFRGQDLSNNTTITPWIEWTRGGFLVDGVVTTFPAIGGGTDPGFGLVSMAGVFNNAQVADITFIGGGSINLKVGDQFYTDGVLPNGAAVMKVEASRFKLGTVNISLSVFSDNGKLVSVVYDVSNVGTLFNSSPFSPRYGWFKAENLIGNAAALAAILTGANSGNAAEVAFVEGTSAPTGPFALTGLTLILSVTVDGVVLDDQTFTFTGAPLANMAAVVTAIGSDIVGIGAIDDSGTLKLATVKTGALQSLTLKGTSSSLTTLGFAAGDQSGTGKDVEFNDVPPNLMTDGNAAPFILGAAAIELTSGNSFPMGALVAGKTLILKLSTDSGGTFPTTRTHIFGAGPFNTISDVVSDITSDTTFLGGGTPDLEAANAVNELKISTVAKGAKYQLKIDATSTGIESQTTGTLQYTNNQIAAGTSKTLVVKISIDSGLTFSTTRTHSFNNASGNFLTVGAVVTEIGTDTTFLGGGTPDLAVSAALTTELSIKAISGNATKVLKADSSSTGINGSNLLAYTPSQLAAGVDELIGQTLKFKVNDRPHVYSTIFVTDSLVDAVTAINATIGMTIASIDGGTDDQLVLTSDLKGAASKVEVIDDSTSALVDIAFGFESGNRTAIGSGRPNPDFSVDISGNVNLGADILRNPVTGAPYDPGQADIYLQYKGLRLDVSPRAQKPALLSISDVATLQTVLSPISSGNPLGAGMFFAMINAPNLVVTGVGVGETAATAPDGTLVGYTEVANFIESQEVYAIAALTHDVSVAQMFKAHVELMSGPEQKGERIFLHNPIVPVRGIDTVVASGLSGNTTATTNEFIGDVNPDAALLTAGINPALPITVDMGVFVELVIDGEPRRYSVGAVNGVVFTFRNIFASGENDDSFYATTPLTETAVNVDWSTKIRGNHLVIPGSTLPDKTAIAATVGGASQAYRQRRFVSVFPDKVKASLTGIEELLPAYFACAAMAGMIAHFPPQQGFTNLPMAGFTGVQGSNDTFSNRQLNVMAGGGTYIIVQDVQGAPIISRHQLTTDLTSIETRELSITKIVDFTAKFLRTGLRNFIGTFNITQPFLDTLSTIIHGMLKFLEENGVLISGDLNNLIQSKNQPDLVLVEVGLNVPFPCNYIRLTLVI